MEYRRLGDSELRVSELCLGSWLTYGTGLGFGQTRACTHAALDAGINFFDTANMYGKGAAEEAWGRILSARPRDSYVLATKLGYPVRWRARPWTWRDRGLGRAQIHRQLERSLERLRTDHVDLYWCHIFDPDTPLEETMRGLTEVVEAGKARHVGFSGWPASAVAEVAAMPGVVRFTASQPSYSLLSRDAERDIFPVCREHDISQVVYSPLAQGVLTGKYAPGSPPPPDSRAASAAMGEWMALDDAVLAAVQRLRPVAAEAGLALPQLALAWVLRRPEVAAAIIGASRPEQVHENVRASGVTLAPDTLAAVDAALASPASA